MHGRPDSMAPDRPCIRTAADVLHLCGHELVQLTHEALRVLHLDHDSRLIAMTGQAGGAHGLRLALGRIVHEAAQHQSRRLLLAHNHPSGDPHPSVEDHVATRRVAELLRSIEVELVDHLILARGGMFSFRGAGLL